MLNMNEPVNKVADLSIRRNILMRQKNQEEKRELCTYFFLVPCQYNESMGK